MTHEFVHYGFPSVKHRHHWIEEGSAVYIEPIASAQVKNLTDEEVWGEMVRVMPRWLPKPGDLGLDYTHTVHRHTGAERRDWNIFPSIYLHSGGNAESRPQ